MQTIQVVIDESLLRDTDRVARRQKLNRSALIREALGLYLRRLRLKELAERDRAGYERHPDRHDDELTDWEGVASWPVCAATAFALGCAEE